MFKYFESLWKFWSLGVVVVFVTVSLLGLLDGRPTEYIRFFESLFLSVALWLVLVALIGNVCWILIVSLPVAFLVPFEIWQRIFIGQPTSMHFLAFAVETTWGEFVNFLLTYGENIAYIFIPWMLIYLWGVYAAYRMRINWRNSLSTGGAIILSGIIIGYYFLQGAPAWMDGNGDGNGNGGAFDGRVVDGWSRQWEDVFPINIGIALQRYYAEQKKMEKIQQSLRERNLDTHLVNEATAPEIVVLVIGESSTARRWSLFGYHHLTTPRLQVMEHVLGFENVVSVSMATRSAVPAAISRQPVLLPTGLANKAAEPSLVQAFGQAGYETHWISNQAPFGKFDSSIAIHAREADFAKFLNPSTFETRSNLDDVLLMPLQDAIVRPRRKLVVLHTLGSHFDYSLRYPESFEKFSPDHQDITHQGLNKKNAQISSSYDNSVLYTDHILSEVVERVRLQGKSAVVVYFSDHGEDLPGEGCDYSGVKRKTASAYQVPVVLWLSEEYKMKHADFWKRLESNRGEPYTIRAISSTLMDLAHVEVKKTGPNFGSFLVRPDLQSMPRMVAVSESMVDYDAAYLKNQCMISTQ